MLRVAADSGELLVKRPVQKLDNDLQVALCFSYSITEQGFQHAKIGEIPHCSMGASMSDQIR